MILVFMQLSRSFDCEIMLYCYMQVLGITLKSLVFAFNKVHFIIDKEFIQVILISGRWLKKIINLLIEF